MELIGRENVGYKIIAAVQYPNPHDHYLYRVVGRKGPAYVTWTYNSQDGGFYHGHYHGNPVVNNRKVAFLEFTEWIDNTMSRYPAEAV